MCLYAEWGKPDELTTWQQKSSKRGGVSDDWLARAGLQMLKSSRYKAAELLLREMLSIREKRDAAHWRTFNAKSLLGGALLGQKKYVEAAIDAQNKIRIPDALERLVLLYTEWHAAEPDKGYDVKAADWQAKQKDFTDGANAKPSLPTGNGEADKGEDILLAGSGFR